MTSFTGLTAIEAASAIAANKFTASEYIGGLCDVIVAADPKLQAFEYFDRAHALAQAEALSRRDPTSDYPLLGAAIGIKDIIDTKDMPTENGTPLDKGRQPIKDADVVQRLRQAGAVIMGKTVTTELAFLTPSRTRNPHNLDHTPGGSSSGSAASVAAGMVPISLGTQTNGSVIRPASYNGLFALKPTNGLFSREGILEESASYDTAGVFARSLADVALATEVLASPGDRAGPLRGRPHFLRSVQTPGSAQPRIAFVKTAAWPLAEPGTQDAFTAVAKSLGSACEELQLPAGFDKAVEYHRTSMVAEIALNYSRYYERGKDRLSPMMQKTIEEGSRIGAVDYCNALRAREKLYARFEELLEPFDAVITPSATGPAPKGHDSTGNPIFCTLWTFLRVPAINLPLLKIANMPLGIQLTGRRFSEAGLFQTAAWLTKALNGSNTVPVAAIQG